MVLLSARLLIELLQPDSEALVAPLVVLSQRRSNGSSCQKKSRSPSELRRPVGLVHGLYDGLRALSVRIRDATTAAGQPGLRNTAD